MVAGDFEFELQVIEVNWLREPPTAMVCAFRFRTSRLLRNKEEMSAGAYLRVLYYTRTACESSVA